MSASPRTLITCLAYVVALVVLAVGVDRVLTQRVFHEPGDRVPGYRLFQEHSAAVKLHEFERVDGRLDAVFVGNSRTLYAVNPVRFDERLEERGLDTRSYNLSMPSVDVRFWAEFFDRFYDRPMPRQVLLGVAPRDVDPRFAIGERYARAFFASPGFRNRDESSIDRWSEEAFSKVFALPSLVAETGRVEPLDVLRGDKRDERTIRLANDRGWVADNPNALPSAELAEKVRTFANRSSDFRLEVGAGHRAELRRLNDVVRAKGGCLTLFTIPKLYDTARWGTVEVDREFRRAMREIVAGLPGARLLDIGPVLQSQYGVPDFGDGDHMTPRGAERFSGQLADAALPALRAPGC